MKPISTTIFILLSATVLCGMQEHQIQMGYAKELSPKELAQRACHIMGMSKNDSLQQSMEQLFAQKKCSPEQEQRKASIIKKISESSEE